MNVKDHTKQIQYFTQNKELMILLPSPAYEHTSICFSYEYTTISLPMTDILYKSCFLFFDWLLFREQLSRVMLSSSLQLK